MPSHIWVISRILLFHFFRFTIVSCEDKVFRALPIYPCGFLSSSLWDCLWETLPDIIWEICGCDKTNQILVTNTCLKLDIFYGKTSFPHILPKHCWCSCNFGMYSLVYFIYCTPMFILGSICNVFESCNFPMFLSRVSIMWTSHVKSLWVTLLLFKG